MKTLKFIATLVLLICTVAIADLTASPKKEKELVTRVYSAHLHCESCVTKVMNTLPFKKGIKDVKVELEQQQITVQYDAEKSSDTIIIKSLKSVDIEASVKKTDS